VFIIAVLLETADFTASLFIRCGGQRSLTRHDINYDVVAVCSINFDFTFDDAMAAAFDCTVKCFDPRSEFFSFSLSFDLCLCLSVSLSVCLSVLSHQ